MEGARKGSRRAASSYRRTPRAQTSAFSVYGWDYTISGERYAGVPQKLCMKIVSSER